MRPALLALALFAGCSSNVVTVRHDGLVGRAVRAWVTVAHVAGDGPVLVRDHWWEGDVLCDPVTTRMGPAEDRVTLLIPRCEDYGRRGPGDSGAPVVDADGRVVGLHLGQRYAEVHSGR